MGNQTSFIRQGRIHFRRFFLGQGRENAKRFLRENPAVADEIEDQIRKQAGLIADVMLVGDDGENDEDVAVNE